MQEDELERIEDMNVELSNEFTQWLRKKYGDAANGRIHAHPSMRGLEDNYASYSATVPRGRGKKAVTVKGDFTFAPNSYGADAAEVMDIPYGQIEEDIRGELEV